MKQTPAHSTYNEDLLKYIPVDAKRVVEVGCSTGSLAAAYLKVNPVCEYIGIEIDDSYAQHAQVVCTRALVGNIETLTDEELRLFGPVDCWVFADVLEHLYDPWAVLEKLRRVSGPGSCVVACVPNAAHWSVQARLMTGAFQYEQTGLLDRTHIRWFTKYTLADMFDKAGWVPNDGMARVFDKGEAKDTYLKNLRIFALMLGLDAHDIVDSANVYQYVICGAFKEI